MIIEIKEKDIKRFWKKVKINDINECWEWIAGKNNYGYGIFGIVNYGNSKNIIASRYSYIIKFGQILNGKYVLHSCDNPSCVNPNHLRLGTAKDNSMDAQARGRARGGSLKGEINPKSKVTEKEVLEIRNLFRNKSISVYYIMKKYNIKSTTVSDIAYGKTWKHVGDIVGKYERNPPKKLNLQIAEEIRELYSTKKYTMKALGKIFNLSYTYINDIIHCRKWKNEQK